MTGRDRAAGERPPAIGIAWAAAAAGLLTTAAGLLGADGALARLDIAAPAVERAWSGSLAALDLIAGKTISNFLLGGLVILASLAGGLGGRKRWARPLLFVGSVQLLSTAIANFAKPPFGRLRPFQAVADGQWFDQWFEGAGFGSFPSGHVAFCAGLALPLALLFPRWRAPLMAVLLLVGLERIVSHDHYVSDVGAALFLAGLTTACSWKLVVARFPAFGSFPSNPRVEIVK